MTNDRDFRRTRSNLPDDDVTPASDEGDDTTHLKQ
jgi:hypothetical protein